MQATEISAEGREMLAEEQRNKQREPVRYRRREGTHAATVSPYGFDMECKFEFSAGEAPVLWGNYPHPGSPDDCSLYECHVGGVDIMEMLSGQQIETIEMLLLEGMSE